MRAFLRLVTSILLLSGNKVTCEFSAPQEYVPLIIKVREYYHASTVFTVHHTDLYSDYGDFPMVYIAHTWSRMLSREGIVTLDVHFHKMYRALRYRGNSVRPLFLVILRDEEAFYKFSRATRTFKMSFAAWFVMFILPPQKGEPDHCHHPTGNPFNVNLNVEMLVLCPDDNILREWYSIDGENIEISELAIWKKELASPFITLTNLSLWERRRNLKGMVLRGMYVKNSPFVKMVNGKPGGMLGCIIQELMEVMNFTIIMQLITKYGSLMEDGKWNGAVGELVADRADIAVSEFTMTANRLNITDYLAPLIVSRNRLYFKQSDTVAVQWFAYFKTFNLWIWICVITVMLLMTISLSIIYWYSGSTRVVELVSDSFLSVWGIFCMQGLSEFPKSSSLRVAFFTTFIVAIVVSAAYSAALISFLTATPRTLPFQTFDEFLRNGRYRLIVVQSTADYELLTESGEKYSHAVKSLMMPKHTLPKDLKEAFAQLCSNPKLVFYTSQDSFRAAIYWIPCQLSSIDADRVDSMSMILQKDSPYTGIINYNILKFMFNGMINRFKGPRLKMNNDKGILFDPVQVTNVAPILTIFCCGVVTGLVGLFIERCYFYVKGVETGMS